MSRLAAPSSSQFIHRVIHRILRVAVQTGEKGLDAPGYGCMTHIVL